MGLMRFVLSAGESLSDHALKRVYMSGMEAVPWRSRAYWDGELLVVERDVSDSGNVHVPWRVDGHGEVTLSTGCLMERERPYQLDVELARGTINQIRNQLALWRAAGLVVPKPLEADLVEATGCLSQAATAQSDPDRAGQHASAALERAIAVADSVGRSYTEQALSVRRRGNSKLSTLLGVNLGRRAPGKDAAGEKTLLSTFNTAVVDLAWRTIESVEGGCDWTLADQQIAWCQEKNQKICGGPLLRLDDGGMPDWTYLWEGDSEHLLGLMLEHVREAVARYRGRVQVWQVASRVNFGRALSLSEEERLRMVVRAVETVRDADPRTPVVVSFDQPWAEYLAVHDQDLSPLHFADALVRAGLGLSGLGLEINAGYHPGGTLRYGLLDYSRLLDRWSQLGLPLLVSLTVPSHSGRDPKATTKAQPLSGANGASHSPQSQQAWVETYVPLMLSKNSVQVIVWNQLQDGEPHDFPHGGLIDASGQPKPAFETLRALREEYLT